MKIDKDKLIRELEDRGPLQSFEDGTKGKGTRLWESGHVAGIKEAIEVFEDFGEEDPVLERLDRIDKKLEGIDKRLDQIL